MPYFMVYIAGLHKEAVRIRAKSEKDAIRKARLMCGRRRPPGRRFSLSSGLKKVASRVLIG